MGVKQRIQEMTSLRTILLLSLISMSLAAVGKDQKTFGWMGDLIFGNCDTSTCRYDTYRARECCNSGRNTRCCSYVGGGGGGGGWNNGGDYNNNKPGSCPPYNGRRKRSPEEAPWATNSGGRHYGNGGWSGGSGRYPSYNNGYGNGGSGFNPGYNNGGYGGGRCIRDSECPGSLKCCYLYSG